MQLSQVGATDDRMTRFWLSLEQGVHFVINCIEQMEGGEVFVPKIDLADLDDVPAPGRKLALRKADNPVS